MEKITNSLHDAVFNSLDEVLRLEKEENLFLRCLVSPTVKYNPVFILHLTDQFLHFHIPPQKKQANCDQ